MLFCFWKQTHQLVKVEREGRIIAVRPTIVPATAATNGETSVAILPSTNGVTQAIPVAEHVHQHFTRPPTSSGGRNMQDTTFSLSAEYPSKFSFNF